MHRMQLPREVFIGNNTLELIGDICKKLGFSKSALVVTGSHTKNVAGQKVMDLLADSGLEVDYVIVTSSTVDDLRTVKEKIKQMQPQIVLGVGGGTKIDVAKLSSSNENLPFISVPTTASHDGISSPLGAIKGFNKPFSVKAQAPMAIVADTGVIMHSPYHFIASGCGDIISKLTAVRDWRLAHNVNREYYGEYADSLALMSAQLLVKNAESIQPRAEEGIRILLEALISSGVAMSIAGSSRPGSGSEHLFSHALDLIAPEPALHGEQCGVGTILMARLHHINWKRIKETLQRVGASTTAEELGVKPEHVVEALVNACTLRPERYTILDEKRLDHDSAEKLAEVTGVIS